MMVKYTYTISILKLIIGFQEEGLCTSQRERLLKRKQKIVEETQEGNELK
jgi:hypothetical protein